MRLRTSSLPKTPYTATPVRTILHMRTRKFRILPRALRSGPRKSARSVKRNWAPCTVTCCRFCAHCARNFIRLHRGLHVQSSHGRKRRRLPADRLFAAESTIPDFSGCSSSGRALLR